jgi:hypothetical protein
MCFFFTTIVAQIAYCTYLQLLILEIFTLETNNKSDDNDELLVDDIARGAFGKRKEKNSTFFRYTPLK